MAGRLQDKIAIVTGAGSGIGAATAQRLAAEGAKVVVNDINAEAGEAVARSIKDAGGTAQFVRADVSDPGEVEGLIYGAVGHFGRLGILHNNAFFSRMGMVGQISPESFRRTLDVTLIGTYHGMHYALPIMARQGSGAVVNTASVSGLAGDYAHGAYNAAKFAVVGLTKTAAIEYARYGVRVNAVCPGPIDTPPVQWLLSRTPGLRETLLGALPNRRLGRPEEIANAVLFLASDEASLINGACLTADGGLSAWTGHPPLVPDLLEREP
jgi:meso-butanediol dehydrogenase/(S,S)-butanediol dehydrogenase/diacetyl reductase